VRRRYIQRGLELVEVSNDYVPAPSNSDAVLWNDRSYQDAGDARFASRSQHREFMKANGLTTVDDYSGQWKRDREKRIAFYRGEDASRRGDIARALEKAGG
jgi:hypothetical protein